MAYTKLCRSCILTITHSNAAEERIFSMTKKNKITFRSSLNLKISLNSIRIIKINEPESLLPCHRTDLPKVLLGKFKTACDKYKNHIERLVVKMRVVVSVSCNISQQTFTKFCSSWYHPL